ncbi:universal stress protein [Streptomyces sp. NPDC093250]|uniref:universal stress protein n=1 Tax=Streptomyces sp. NPDC093250 TaxID=3366036 RepID=UPI0038301612
MEHVPLASITASAPSQAAADWASDEARLHGLPLRVVHEPPQDFGEARMVVHSVRREEFANSRTGAAPLLTAAVERAARPLVFVPDDLSGVPHLAGVTVGVDARAPSGTAIDFAFECARIRGSGLHVVHAWSLPASAADLPFGIPEEDRATWEDQEVQQLADALRPWREKHPQVPVLEDVVLLTQTQALLHFSAGAALVVVGQQHGADRGEMMRSLVHEAACPVAVVPS